MKRTSGMIAVFRFLLLILLTSPLFCSSYAKSQDWVHTGTNLSNSTLRIAAADFKPTGGDPQTQGLKVTFDTTLFSDLNNAGIFDVVSKSLAPQAMPGSLIPRQICLRWTSGRQRHRVRPWWRLGLFS